MIKHPYRVDWFVGVLLFIGKKKLGLVDSGFENTPTEYIFPLIKELGYSLDDLTYVVFTHRDYDHTQGSGAIRQNTSAILAAHELEFSSIPDIDVKLKEGDQIELGDRKFEVLHMPGHRPGAICLYDAGTFLLVSGDVICGDRVDLIRMDKKIYIASLTKLLKLKTRFLIMSHPFKPLGKALLKDEEPKRMIEASLAIAEKL